MPALCFHIARILPLLLLLGPSSASGQHTAMDTATVLRAIDEGYTTLARNPDSARGIYEQALQQSRAIKYVAGEVAALRGIGVIYATLGQYDSSLSTSFRALDLAKHRMPGSNEISFLYNNIASVYVNFGDLKEAAAYYFKVLGLTRKSGNIPGRVQALNNLSEVFAGMGDYSRGLDCIAEALVIAPQSAYGRDMIPFLYINQAGLLSGSGRQDAALVAVGTALQLNGSGQRQNMVTAEAYLTQGEILEKMNKVPNALQAYQQALLNSGGYPLGKERALANLGKLYRRSGDYGSAIHYLLQALSMAKATHSLRELAAIYEELAASLTARSRFREAAMSYQMASRLKDSLNTVESNRNISLMEYRYRTAVKDKELAQKQMLLLQQHQQLTRKNWVIAGIGSGCLVLAILLFFIIRSFRQRESLQRQQGEIRVWKATLEGEEKERGRLARELHDNIGGSLSNVKMWFGTIRDRHQALRHETEYSGALQLLEQTLAEVRNTAHHLMPELLLRHGLAEAVHIFCHNVQKASGLHIDFIYLGYIGMLEPGMELLVYRSIQELVQNVVRHARASYCLVQLAGNNGMLSITIEDNGCGMDNITGAQAGMGLPSIRKSMERIGAGFRLESQPGKGTVINIDINLPVTDKTTKE